MTTMSAIRAKVQSFAEGEPFTSSDLLDLGSRASVDQALSRMVRSGTIERITRGVFVRPRSNRYFGTVPPAPEKVAQAVARASNSVIEVHGAEAAREFGLTNQAPMRPTFLTSGRSRDITFAGVSLEMQHGADKRLLLAGTPAGRAFAALMYLGKKEVTLGTIETLRGRLPPKEFDALISAASSMPSWLSDTFYRFKKQPAA